MTEVGEGAIAHLMQIISAKSNTIRLVRDAYTEVADLGRVQLSGGTHSDALSSDVADACAQVNEDCSRMGCEPVFMYVVSK